MRCPVITRGGGIRVVTASWSTTLSRDSTGGSGTEARTVTRSLPFAPKMLFAEKEYIPVNTGDANADINIGFGGQSGRLSVNGKILQLTVYLYKNSSASGSIEYTIIG